MDMKVQKIKIEYAKHRTNGYILDFLIKSLGIEQQDQKTYQRFIKEENISANEYYDTLNTVIEDIIYLLIGNTSNDIFTLSENILKEFLSYYNLIKINNETLATSQKQLDCITLINLFIPIISNILSSNTIISKIIPDKRHSSMQKLFSLVKPTLNDNLEKCLFNVLDDGKSLNYDAINKLIKNWITGKNNPDNRHIDLISNLANDSNSFNKETLKLYFNISKILDYLFLKSSEYFGDNLTILLVQHYEILSTFYFNYKKVNFNQRIFEDKLKKLFKDSGKDFNVITGYLERYFYNSNDFTFFLLNKSLDNQTFQDDEYNKKIRFIRDNYKYEQLLYFINENDFFNTIETIVPVKYFYNEISYKDLQDLDISLIDDKFKTYSELLEPIYIATLPSQEKTKEDEEKLIVNFETFEDSYDTENNPYYSFLKARYYAQKRCYEKSTKYYLIALEHGKNCMGTHIQSIIKEGLWVSAQDTRKKQVDLINAKSNFTKFYKEAYFYKLLDNLPDEINIYFLNDMKKQFDIYFRYLYPDIKKVKDGKIAKDLGIICTEDIDKIKVNLDKPNKTVKVHKNDESQLCFFAGKLKDVQELVKNDADVNYKRFNDNYTALIATLENNIEKDHIKIAKLLIPKMSKEVLNAKLPKKQETALSYAINKGLVEIIELLIQYGVDVEQRITLDEETALYYSIMVINIVQNGINNKTKFKKINPLEDENELEKILKTHNFPNKIFDNEKKDAFKKYQDNPIFRKCMKNEKYISEMQKIYSHDNLDNAYKIFDFVLNATIKVDAPHKHNITPLIFATELNEVELVKKLLEKGANPDYYTKEGARAYDYALKNNNQELMELLE